MTLAAAPSFALGVGNGVVTTFPYAFPINTTDGSDIQVWILDNLGNPNLITSNYSVNVGQAKVNYPTVGGVFPLGIGVTALPAGWTLVMLRIEPLSQLLSLSNNGVFDAPSIMAALDKIVMIEQQLQEQINRCYKVPPGTLPASTVQPNVAPQNPFNTGTYAALKAIAAANPTFPFIGFATDLGVPGEYTQVYYTGNAAAANTDQGFIIP